ncbi:hypothetical protein H5410_016345 [Solanum commersonii]|uniref:Uncharacterized protein n=1 Tax=Solanum commersonii TaxID=4109 RepID=A0A9J5ZW69_SOLCO|nr:hypothetical protein H5410_016345 [Solanum commersonii]
MTYDNEVSALGKICNFLCDSIDSAQIFLLPIKAYLIEAKVLHDQCSVNSATSLPGLNIVIPAASAAINTVSL